MGGDVSNPARMAEKQQILRFLEVKMLSLVAFLIKNSPPVRSVPLERSQISCLSRLPDKALVSYPVRRLHLDP